MTNELIPSWAPLALKGRLYRELNYGFLCLMLAVFQYTVFFLLAVTAATPSLSIARLLIEAALLTAATFSLSHAAQLLFSYRQLSSCLFAKMFGEEQKNRRALVHTLHAASDSLGWYWTRPLCDRTLSHKQLAGRLASLKLLIDSYASLTSNYSRDNSEALDRELQEKLERLDFFFKKPPHALRR